VCSPGGHLTELLELAPAFEGCDTQYFCYTGETTALLPGATLVPNRPYNPWRYVTNFRHFWREFRRRRPVLLVSTGAEIAIPVFVAAKLLRIPSLYIECGAQVTQASATGRIVIRLADTFLVQWPELCAVYGAKAHYRGSLIDGTAPE
jgi:UDP-N-acetylglucosamine:LPS N-acetylglucosamine transferase